MASWMTSNVKRTMSGPSSFHPVAADSFGAPDGPLRPRRVSIQLGSSASGGATTRKLAESSTVMATQRTRMGQNTREESVLREARST